eukprot:maker-scaffold506_size152672-snap-gene-0.21 protein:Tk07581 transcript:maker-scaffold506_size152672-snap-gene-0.21-mRNA-1 annotation:"neurotrimin isoform x4"
MGPSTQLNDLNPQVAWVRVDTQTILTIHHHIITRNQRVSLSHHDHEIWRLHLENIQESDKGWYMCQINTDPMRSRKGYLDVVVPPRIVDSLSSSDMVVKENTPVNLTCEARGSPKPELRWRRADGEMIRYRGGMVLSVEGNSLVIPSATRAHIGKYYCIASNGVPPTITKNMELKVQFAPMVWVQNQLEFVPLGHNITLQCNTESYPPAIHYWTFKNGSAITSGRKFRTSESSEDLTTHAKLDIVHAEAKDFGTFICIAKNSLGQQDGHIKLEERELPSTTFQVPPAPTGGSYWGQLTTSDYRNRETKAKHGELNVFGSEPFVPESGQREEHGLDTSADQRHQYNSQQSANLFKNQGDLLHPLEANSGLPHASTSSVLSGAVMAWVLWIIYVQRMLIVRKQNGEQLVGNYGREAPNAVRLAIVDGEGVSLGLPRHPELSVAGHGSSGQCANGHYEHFVDFALVKIDSVDVEGLLAQPAHDRRDGHIT